MAIKRVPRFLVLTACMAAFYGCGGGSGSISVPPPNQPPPPPPGGGIALRPVFDQLSFTAPVVLLQAPGDATRWFVVEQAGIIRVFDADENVASSTVFADIRARVDDGPAEAGLLGMAFHPDFVLNGEVFLSYTRGGPLESVVSRFVVEAGGQQLDEASEEVILTALQPDGNHNGGNLAFGPSNRLLYIGFGDGGGSGDPNENGQNTSTYLGAIVRVDVDGNPPYEIPNGNPFSSNTECPQGVGTAPCPEIFAWGFRNPWRFSFDRQTSQLWVGDVGQGSFEEIDRVEGGLNYGWDEREGAHCFEPSSGCSTQNVDPITEYGRDLGQSVTGGYVYRGSAVPDLLGDYVFGDFVSGRIFRVPADSQQGTVAEELLDTALGISSFGEDFDGELYVLDYGTGTIHQVVAAP